MSWEESGGTGEDEGTQRKGSLFTYQQCCPLGMERLL